jgi:ribosomal 50S subunit-associated protein YjgA (DUF615 family)
MTRKGATLVINSMMIRLSEIESAREKLAAEEKQLVLRIHELEKVRDPIIPNRIVLIA